MSRVRACKRRTRRGRAALASAYREQQGVSKRERVRRSLGGQNYAAGQHTSVCYTPDERSVGSYLLSDERKEKLGLCTVGGLQRWLGPVVGVSHHEL